MWDWLEDRKYYSVTLWGATLFLGLVPFITGTVLPITFWPVCFLSAKIILSIWSGDILDGPQLGRLVLPTDHAHPENERERPRGRGVVFVRLRLAAFTAFTASAFATIVPILLEIDLGENGLISFMALWFVFFLVVTFFSKWWLLNCLVPARVALDVVRDAYVFWTGFTKADVARDEALQRLYNFENQFYVAIAGYPSRYDFTSNPKSLTKDIPDFHD